MPDLMHSFKKQDLGFLQISASLWGMAISANDINSACEELVAHLLDPKTSSELFSGLNQAALEAIQSLIHSGGRIPWGEFIRQHGEVREMGPGRRDRDHSTFQPISTSEFLFYLGAVARDFFDTPPGPIEFAYVPDDLSTALRAWFRNDHPGMKRPSIQITGTDLFGRPAISEEVETKWTASDRVLDDATTRLAALRSGHHLPADARLIALLQTTGLIKGSTLSSNPVKAFLKASRGEAHSLLIQAWRGSDSFNELRLMPGFIFEGEWKNPVHPTRQFLLNTIAAVPIHKWWSLNAFVADIKNRHPDFQRAAGDYDAWYIKRGSDGAYLRGFEHWDEVEGGLIRFFITGILHWLGLADLAGRGLGHEILAFQVHTNFNETSLPGAVPSIPEDGKIKIDSQGMIRMTRSVPRAARYQIARFASWGKVEPDALQLWITGKSLTNAKAQGLRTTQLINLLLKHSQSGVPPSLLNALQRWEKYGTEAKAETHAILQVSRPEILVRLRKSKASRYLGAALSPTAVIVHKGAMKKVMNALAESGYLMDDSTSTELHP